MSRQLALSSIALVAGIVLGCRAATASKSDWIVQDTGWIVVFGKNVASRSFLPLVPSFTLDFTSEKLRLYKDAHSDCEDKDEDGSLDCVIPLAPSGWYHVLICDLCVPSSFAYEYSIADGLDINDYIRCPDCHDGFPLAQSTEAGTSRIELKLHSELSDVDFGYEHENQVLRLVNNTAFPATVMFVLSAVPVSLVPDDSHPSRYRVTDNRVYLAAGACAPVSLKLLYRSSYAAPYFVGVVVREYESAAVLDSFQVRIDVDNSAEPVEKYIYSFALDADGDDDGLDDCREGALGTLPNNPDTDGDQLPDGWEAEYIDYDDYYRLDPTDGDVNNNGRLDGEDDVDNDLLTNFDEFTYGTNPFLADSDGDGLDDYDEIHGTFGYLTDPTDEDTDHDGRNDYDEVHGTWGYVTDPTDEDTDDDGLLDWDEVRDLNPYEEGRQNPFDPLLYDSTGDDFSDVGNSRADGDDDYDGDGMSNSDEIRIGRSPILPLSCTPAVRWIGTAIMSAAIIGLAMLRRAYPDAGAIEQSHVARDPR